MDQDKANKPADETAEKPVEEKPSSADDKPAETDIEAKNNENTDEVDVDQPTEAAAKPEESLEVADDDGSFRLDIKEGPKHKNGGNKSWVILLVILLVAVVAVAVWWFVLREDSTDEPADETTTADVQVFEQAAAVTYVEGDVEYYYALGWQDVAPGTTLRVGDQIRTNDNSKAIITLDEGSAIRLDENTEIELVAMTNVEVTVENVSGSVYSRVTESDNREFSVVVADDNYTALGTAYRTKNTDSETGVEVFQSQVKVGETTVEEGKEFYIKHPDSEKVARASDIDAEKLVDDEFVNWNKEQDEKETEFSSKLGFLKDVEAAKEQAEKEEPDPAPEPAPSSPSAKLTLSASAKAGSGVVVSWTNSGIFAGDGYKVVFDRNDTTPSYGENSSKYVGKDSTSITLPLTDGKSWNIRVCTYRPASNNCTNYSNGVTVTAPFVEKEKVTRGEITASLDAGSGVLSWSYTGKAPYGYKVVWNTGGDPTYPEDNSRLVGGTELNLNDKISDGTWKVRVCAYTSGTISEKCVDYSNQIDFTKP